MIRRIGGSIGRAIDAFFFRPASPRAIGLFRIFYSLVLLQMTLVHLAPDVLAWYGAKAVVPASVSQEQYHHLFPHINVLLLFPGNDGAVIAFFQIFVGAIVCLLLGLATRVSSVVVFVCILTLQNQNPYNLNSADVLLRLTAFFLMFSRCADAYSLDRVLNTATGKGDPTALKHTDSSPWAQRLLQLQLAIVYTHATASKALASDWQSGSAVYYAGRYEEMKRFCLPFTFDVQPVWNFLTWSTILVEGSLALLVWFRPLTRWILLAGLGLHAGLEVSMNIPMFQWTMMSYYVLFMIPEDLDFLLRKIRDVMVRLTGLRPVLLPYSGRELLQSRRVCVIKHFDVLHLIEIGEIDDIDIRDRCGIARQSHGGLRLDNLMVVQEGESPITTTGFNAFRQIAKRVPAFWPMIPFLYLPGVAAISAMIFETVNSAVHTPSSGQKPENKAWSAGTIATRVAITCIVLVALFSATRSFNPVHKDFTRSYLIAAREAFARKELRRTLPLDTVAPATTSATAAQQLSQNANLERSTYHSLDELKEILGKQTNTSDARAIVAALRELDAQQSDAQNEERWKAVSRLADVYWQDNRLDDADMLLLYVWERRADQFKRTMKEDPELLATVLAIAAVKRDATDYAGAEQYMTMAVRYKQRVYGKENKSTLIDCANLALIQYLYGQSLSDPNRRAQKWKEASELYQSVVADTRRLYPNDKGLLQRILASQSFLQRDAEALAAK